MTLGLFADEPGRELSDASWMALTRFYRNLHAGYRVCLPGLSTTGKTSDQERSDAVLSSCRAMAALGRHKTLMRMRYRDVDLAHWEQTLELASWAAGIGGAHAQLAALAKQARASSELPEWLAPVRLELESYRHLLDLLLSHWSTQPPQRRQRRDQAQGDILATHGVAQVRRMLAASEYAKAGGQRSYEDNTPYDYKLFGKTRFGSVDQSAEKAVTPSMLTPWETLQKFELEGDRQMPERWNVTGQSASGLGSVAPSHGG